MCVHQNTNIFGPVLTWTGKFFEQEQDFGFSILARLRARFQSKNPAPTEQEKKWSRISSEFLDQNQEFSEILLQNQNQDRPNFGRRRPIVIETENPIIGLSDNAISDNNIYSPFYRFKIAINTMRQQCRYRQIAYEDIKEEGYYRDFFGM